MGLEKLKRKGYYLMSNFKIVHGINPKDQTIINFDKIIKIQLDREYLENANCVRIFSEGLENLNFETDLTSLRQVSLCLHSKEIVISFSADFLIKSLKSIEEDGYRIGDETLDEIGIERVGDGLSPIREEKI